MSAFYNANPKLKSVGVKLPVTVEQVAEWEKCASDPVYFIQNYVKIITLDHGLVSFDLFDYQIDFIKSLHENRRVIGMFPRQHGKCVEKETKYNIRNKNTGEIISFTAEEFHEICNKNV